MIAAIKGCGIKERYVMERRCPQQNGKKENCKHKRFQCIQHYFLLVFLYAVAA